MTVKHAFPSHEVTIGHAEHCLRPDKETNREAARNGVESLLLVEKNRNGKTGEVKVNFFPSLMEFRTITHKYGEQDIPASMKQRPES